MFAQHMGAVVASALLAAASHAPADVNIWGIGNAAGDVTKSQILYGFDISVDFNTNTGNVQLISSTPVVDLGGGATTTNDLLNPTVNITWNPGLGYVDGKIYASNQFNNVAPTLLTGEIDPSTGVYRGISDQGATDPNPIPSLGPVVSSNPRSNGLAARADGNLPGQGNQDFVVGITQDAVQYGFEAGSEIAIGNIGPVPLGLDPVEDIEGLGADGLNDTVYAIDDRAAGVPVLLTTVNPSGPGLVVTETPLPFLAPSALSLDNFGLTYDPGNDALIISATATDAFGVADTFFFAVNPDDPMQIVDLPDVSGAQIGGLAAVPTPGVATLIALAGAWTTRRRR